MPSILVPSSAKRIATQVLVIAKIKWRKVFYFGRLCLQYHPSQQGISCSKLATEVQ